MEKLTTAELLDLLEMVATETHITVSGEKRDRMGRLYQKLHRMMRGD